MTKRIIEIIKRILSDYHKQRTIVLALSCVVVFVTVYMLILPALTLTKEVAEEQGGIDITETVEQASFEEEQDEEAAEPEEEAVQAEEMEPVEEYVEEEAVQAEETEPVEEAVQAEEMEPVEEYVEEEAVQAEETEPVEEAVQAEETEPVEEAVQVEENAYVEEEPFVDPEEISEEISDTGIIESDDDVFEQEEEEEEDEVLFEAGTLTAKAKRYLVEVTYGEDAGVPSGSDLEVEEILSTSKEYDDYLSKAEDALGWDEGSASYIRLFDIKIVDADGNKVEIEAPVDVRIKLSDIESESDAQVVHFADGAEEGEVVNNVAVDGEEVSFQAEGFSAYAIVEGPDAEIVDGSILETLADLSDAAANNEQLYLSVNRGSGEEYFTNTLSGTIIKITEPKNLASAGIWIVEPTGTENEYRIRTVDGKYIKQTKANEIGLTSSQSEGSVFVLSQPENGSARFYFKLKGDDRWLQYSNGGKGIRLYTDNTNAANSTIQIMLVNPPALESDPYGLDGMEYGLMNWNGGAAGKAMMSVTGDANELEAKSLTVMTTTDNSARLFVPNESDISMWNFHWINSDIYQLTTVVDGSTKYLRIDGSGLSLVSEPDAGCNIQVVPGTGIHSGQIYLRSGNTTLTYSGKIETGFSVGGSVGSEWLNFVELSELTDEYGRTYSARKVSVSDASVSNGSRIIVYTRSWNEKTKKYEFYAIGSDGTLVPVQESGDSIEWVGGQLNKLLWNFVEYYWEGTANQNHYYELYNQYSEKYIAPQIGGGQILSDDIIGINLNGRRDGKYYSTILAWDESNYSYAGLKVEDGKIVSCPKSEAMDFYFAIMEDLNVDDTLHTVPTVDHTQYGITMKMINFATRKEMSDFLGNDGGGLGTTLHQGLLSTGLDGEYPTVKSGKSLGTLYNGAKEVNHLFIQSTYDGTGYFEYNSTENFATLKGKNSGDFTVYKELGSYDSASERPTLKHGQFFPYNDLEAGIFTSVNSENLYQISGTGNNVDPLPDGDPRKHEKLYSLENNGKSADCYFGMELEASFTQTPSGLDAWGHDIIFEFTGDDDFWLYVDGELVIDLGGIHSAVPGSVNFRTGEVNVNGNKTTLRALFESNFRKRNPNATDAQVAEFLNTYFDEGSTVFKDYTNHTMRIFYMERGAGASNLHMRFNLAAVKSGTVQLTKQLAGVDESEEVLAEFPYQIWYKKSEDEGAAEYRLTNALPDNASQNDDYVIYKDTVNPVKYEQSVTIDGIEYEDVFFLKPGETADISFPEDMTSYRIVECGVNTDVYKGVTVNDTAVDGTAGTGYKNNRKDYGIAYATTDARAKVKYVNEVDPDALRTLTITKQLLDETGLNRINYPDDTTTFSFRLYLATEFEELNTANMYTYHVKDPDGYYCKWDTAEQKFVKIGEGITSYTSLTTEQKKAATFTTSVYGSITKIPVDHTVEIRDVLAGTQFMAQERTEEIPDGYSFQKYIYNGVNSDADADTGISGTVTTKTDPAIIVCNLKGWGLRVNKVWTDADYMKDREPAYFAIFVKGNDGELSLVGDPDTVRQMAYCTKPQTLYWYFEHLPVAGTSFDDYVIREVTITGEVTVGEDGTVSGYKSVTPVEDGETIELKGIQKGETEASKLTYTVNYSESQISEDSNVRVDTVTNDRPGIILKKTDWEENPLGGAIFTMADSDGNVIGTFTSDSKGLITTAFLSNDKEYTVTETRTPQGYYTAAAEVTIKQSNGTVTVSGGDSDYYTLTQASGTTLATLTFKNRPWSLKAVKVDGDTDLNLDGAHFALHKETKVDEVTNFDVNPMPGYEDLITIEDGSVPKVDSTLPAGKYQLRETTAPDGYQDLPGYVEFSVSKTGNVELLTSADWVSLTETAENEGTLEYTLKVNNYIDSSLTLTKIDENEVPLAGSMFRLCKYDTSWEEVSAYSEIDLTSKASIDLEHLSVGRYCLEETAAPDGYVMIEKYTYFNIAQDGTVTLTDENGTGVNSNNDASFENGTIYVVNHIGTELPEAGGIGTTLFYVLGSILVIGGAVYFVAKKRMK